MGLTFFKNTVLLVVLTIFSCGSSVEKKEERGEKADGGIRVTDDENLITDVEGAIVLGIDQFRLYSELLKNKNVGVVANQTSIKIDMMRNYLNDGTEKIEYQQTHLVDFLLSKKVSVQKVFAPEHGFRGTADAGEHVKDGVDSKTGVPLISLYGSNKNHRRNN